MYYHDGIDAWHARLIIDTLGTVSSNGNITPLNDNVFSLGTSENRWTTVYATNGTKQTSDIRLKANVATIPNALAAITSIRGVYYNWLNDNNGRRKVGFIAQEVEHILPEVVYSNPNDGLKSINYAEITAVLVEAVKEQQQIIEKQNNELESLKSEIEAIKSLIGK